MNKKEDLQKIPCTDCICFPICKRRSTSDDPIYELTRNCDSLTQFIYEYKSLESQCSI